MGARTVIAGYVLALVVFAAIAVAAFLHFERFDREAGRVRHTERVLLHLEKVLGDHLDAQTAVRGHLITEEEAFLEHYERALREAEEGLEALARLTRDHPGQQRRLARLRQLSSDKGRLLAETVEIQRTQDTNGAMEVVRSGRGKVLMDEIRGRIAEMEREETRLLRKRAEQAEGAAWRTSALILFGNGFAFSLLAASTLMLGREINRRQLRDRLRELHLRGEALAAEEEALQTRMEAVLDEMPVGVLLAIVPSGEVIYTNRHMEDLFGGPVPKIRGDDDYAALQMVRADGTLYAFDEIPMIRALRQGQATHNEEVQVLRADGTPITLVLSASPFRDGQGRVAGMVAAFTDYTEAKRTREERHRAELFRDLFLRAVGHDLRNPLSVITTGTHSLQRRPLPEAELKVVERMASSAERMTRMIDQLLGLVQARLGTGIPVERRPSSLGQIVQRAVERMEVAHPDRKVTLKVEGRLEGQFDPKRMEEVVADLLANAFEHGAPETPVAVSARREGLSAVIEVFNAGQEIPEDLLPLIFDPFRRAAERQKGSGFGLGLYLSLQVVRLHGGNMDVSSTRRGTTFRVLLPD
jgi:PAS domain S-box-containing protein